MWPAARRLISTAAALLALAAPGARTVPGSVCFVELNRGNCGGAPRSVFTYVRAGSRCELATWRGCSPAHNRFPSEPDCIHACIFSRRPELPQTGYRAVFPPHQSLFPGDVIADLLKLVQEKPPRQRGIILHKFMELVDNEKLNKLKLLKHYKNIPIIADRYESAASHTESTTSTRVNTSTISAVDTPASSFSTGSMPTTYAATMESTSMTKSTSTSSATSAMNSTFTAVSPLLTEYTTDSTTITGFIPATKSTSNMESASITEATSIMKSTPTIMSTMTVASPLQTESSSTTYFTTTTGFTPTTKSTFTTESVSTTEATSTTKSTPKIESTFTMEFIPTTEATSITASTATTLNPLIFFFNHTNVVVVEGYTGNGTSSTTSLQY